MDNLFHSPSVSIIVLNYNGKNFLDECLTSIFNTKYENFEIILVDNGSIDGSVEYVKEKFGKEEKLKILALNQNMGFAQGNNEGFKIAKGEYVVFLNNDVRVKENWLKELIKIMEENSNIGAAQPKILLDDGIHIDAAGCFIDYMGRVYQRGVFEEDKGQYNSIDEIFYAKGAAIIIRRKVLEEVDIFDPSYFIYYDETDLCWRIWLKGYKVVYIPSSIIYHKGGATMGKKRSPEAMFHARKNHIATLIKNYEMKNLVKYLTPLIIRMLMYSIKLFLKRNLSIGKSYIKAIFWNIVHLKEISKKRAYVQNYIRKISDKEVMSKMLNPHEFEKIKYKLKVMGLIEF
ncbi:MAG: glycosyltransferase family 2 protein [Nitrososphaerota archaeon]